jgi:hypothetical protein
MGITATGDHLWHIDSHFLHFVGANNICIDIYNFEHPACCNSIKAQYIPLTMTHLALHNIIISIHLEAHNIMVTIHFHPQGKCL